MTLYPIKKLNKVVGYIKNEAKRDKGTKKMEHEREGNGIGNVYPRVIIFV